MIVFSRRPSQRFRIFDHIIVTIVAIREGKVRVGVEADRSIPVHREEVWEEIKENGGDDKPAELFVGSGI